MTAVVKSLGCFNASYNNTALVEQVCYIKGTSNKIFGCGAKKRYSMI